MDDSDSHDEQEIEPMAACGHLSTAPAQDQISTRATKIKDLENAIRGNKAEEVKSLLKKDLGLIEETFSFKFYAKDSEEVEEIGQELTPLILATRLGFSEIVGILLDNGADILAKAKNKELSILELALEQGDQIVARIILKRGKRADMLLELTSGRYKWTPLFHMTFNKNLDAVKVLLEHNAKTDATDVDGDTALHLAAMQGCSDIAEELIERNALALEKGNNCGDTPLLMAARWGKDNVVGVFLRNGANREARNIDGDAPMHLAARFDHLDVVKTLFNYQGEGIKLLGMQNKLGETPYLIAARFEAVSSAQFFLDNGTNLSERDGTGNSALHVAAREGSLKVAKLLVERGKKLNLLDSTNENSETPLLVAIQFGRDNIVEYLLKTTANLEITDKYGSSALHLALGRGSTGRDLLEMLLTNERVKVKLLNMGNNAGETPYLLAARIGDEEAVQRLREYGANPNAQDQDGNFALHLAARHGMLDIVKRVLGGKPADPSKLEAKNNFEESPYLIAVKFNQTEAARTLIEYGANPEACDKEGNSALHLASKNGHIYVIEALSLAEGQVGGSSNKQNDTPMTLAARARHLEVLEYLLSLNKDRIPADIQLPPRTIAKDFFESARKGYICLFKKILQSRDVLLDKKNELGMKALDLAVESNQLEILDYLLIRKLDFDTEGMDTTSMFHESARKGYLQLIKKLLGGRNELIRRRYELGRTALHIACENGHTDIVNYLCNNGADIEAKDIGGNRPLHYAVLSRSESVVESLVSRGANQTATNLNGRNALHMACSNSDTLIVQILLSDRADHVKISVCAADAYDETPLCYAVSSGEEGVIFQILESENYFPRKFLQNPTNELSENERILVSTWLAGWIRPKDSEQVNHSQKEKATRAENVDQGKLANRHTDSRIECLICWAILNRDTALLRLGMGKGFLPQLSENGGQKSANWLHIVALAGDCNIADEICEWIVQHPGRWKDQRHLFWDDFLKTDAATGLTPLHVAAKMGHHDLVSHFLSCLAGIDPGSRGQEVLDEIIQGTENQEAKTKVLRAIVQETRQEDNLITLTVIKAMQASSKTGYDGLAAANQKENHFQTLEDHLWKIVMSIVHKDSAFFKFPCEEDAELVIKTILWRDTMLLNDATESWICVGRLKERLGLNNLRQANLLSWAVRRKHPIAVYWILSSGRYFTETQISECESIMQGWNTHRTKEDLEINQRIQRQRILSHSFLERDIESLELQRSSLDEKPVMVKKSASSVDQSSSGNEEKSADSENPANNHGEIERLQVEAAIQDLKLKIEVHETKITESAKVIEALSRRLMVEMQIKRLIESPPPSRPRKGGTEPPQFHFIVDSDEQTATVLDLFLEGNQVVSELRRESLHTIIYTSGPERLMKTRSGVPNYQGLKRILFCSMESEETPEAVDKKIRHLNKTTALSDVIGASQIAQKVRWIHIPVNNLQYVQELMVRIFREKGRDAGSYRALAASVRKSISEHAAGGGNHYINPNCQTTKNRPRDPRIQPERSWQLEKEWKASSEYIDLTALYIPYISWGHTTKDKGKPDISTALPWPRGSLSTKGDAPAFGITEFIHRSLTLDQYYYAALDDTNERDCDQVLSRYFKVFDKSHVSQDSSHVRVSQDSVKMTKHRVRDKVIQTQILLVNQLWLWILDDDTIITSTTQEQQNVEYPFLQRVLRELPNLNGSLNLEVRDIAQLIMDTATKVIDAQEIETLHMGLKSPFGVFRESWQHIRNQEARLFVDFERKLKKEKRRAYSHAKDETDEDNVNAIWDSDKTVPSKADPQGNPETWWERLKKKVDLLKEKADENPYEDILTETKLLVEVKNILDELNILRNLIEDQYHVYSLWKGIKQDAKTNQFNFPHLVEKQDTIKTMIEDLNSVQESIKSLLDLKQKEATIIEAQTTRRQSDSVIVFTVVTIIFLPASFLASLFALNVKDFPHENGSVTYKSSWIFPIIFGVSLAFSLVFVPIALSANTFRNILRVWESREKSKKELEEHQKGIEELRDDSADRQGVWFARRLRNRARKASTPEANTV